SRVALSSDQSLNDYEAYRRGDRFYVKIPPADVPRAEIVRGRAFGDVKVQRSADSTVVSFRLQPGATARVEQRGNKLDVVFKMPAGSSAANTTNREVARSNAGPLPPNSNRRAGGDANTSSLPSSLRGSTNKNSSDRTNAANAKPTPTPRPTPTPKPSPTPATSPKASPTLQPSPGARTSPLVAQQKSSPAASSSQNQPPVQGNTWNNLKDRARYWVLLAQLNPIPVAIGVGVLLLLLGLFVLQRRRAKATRRVRPRKAPKAEKPAVEVSKAAPSVSVPSPSSAPSPAPVEAAAVLGSAVAASTLAA